MVLCVILCLLEKEIAVPSLGGIFFFRSRTLGFAHPHQRWLSDPGWLVLHSLFLGLFLSSSVHEVPHRPLWPHAPPPWPSALALLPPRLPCRPSRGPSTRRPPPNTPCCPRLSGHPSRCLLFHASPENCPPPLQASVKRLPPFAPTFDPSQSLKERPETSFGGRCLEPKPEREESQRCGWGVKEEVRLCGSSCT